jgi:hypothetical protein
LLKSCERIRSPKVEKWKKLTSSKRLWKEYLWKRMLMIVEIKCSLV